MGLTSNWNCKQTSRNSLASALDWLYMTIMFTAVGIWQEKVAYYTAIEVVVVISCAVAATMVDTEFLTSSTNITVILSPTIDVAEKGVLVMVVVLVIEVMKGCPHWGWRKSARPSSPQPSLGASQIQEVVKEEGEEGEGVSDPAKHWWWWLPLPRKLGGPYQLLEYQTDMRRCRFDIINLGQCSAHT